CSTLILASIVQLLLRTSSILAQVEWTPSDQNPVFTIGELGAWDSGTMSAMWLLKRDNEYVLWYQARLNQSTTRRHIECATSSDPLHWQRCPGNPVIPGSRGQWDESIVMPCVIHDREASPPYKVWYSGFVGEGHQRSIGYATSTDGYVWTKHGKPV